MANCQTDQLIGWSPVSLKHHQSLSSNDETSTAAAAAESPGTAASSAHSKNMDDEDELLSSADKISSSRRRPSDQAYRERLKKTKMEIELKIGKLEYENEDLKHEIENLKQENASLAISVEKLTDDVYKSELVCHDLLIGTEKLKCENAHLRHVNDLAHRLSQLERRVQCSNLKAQFKRSSLENDKIQDTSKDEETAARGD